jgi:GNAT superfamily N-acetyltransferase
MAEATLKIAGPDDWTVVVDMLRAMLEELATIGGRALVDDEEAWRPFVERARAALETEDHVFVLALDGRQAVGLAEARVRTMPPFLGATRMLHVHSVYVRPDRRNRGTGGRLLDAVLDWGRERGCAEAELNTLVGNPARHLFESRGFAAVEVEMTRAL